MPYPKMKSAEEVFSLLSDLIHRHRRRYIKRFTRPCPDNCEKATMKGNRVVGCSGCGSHNPQRCFRVEQFSPAADKDDLAEEFRDMLRDPEVLLREYRDITSLLWVLGHFDEKQEAPEEIIAKAEKK